MSTHNTPSGRLDYEGDLTPVIEEVCEAYALGQMDGFSVIEVG